MVAFDNQIVPSTSINGAPTVLLSPAFYRAAAGRPFLTADDAGVRLALGASPAAFVRAASALAARYPATGGKIDTVDLADEVTAVERAIRPQAIALAVFAALAGLVALAVMAQLLSRGPAASALTGARWLTVIVPLPGHLLSTRLARSMRTAGVGGLPVPPGPC